MTDSQRYDRFIDFIANGKNENIADFFQTSESSIKRWKNGEVAIPKWAIKIIELYLETVNLEKKNDNLGFELTGMKQRIYDYKQAKEDLFNVINS